MYYSPVRHFTQSPKEPFSFDLHVLGTPPALILSQDQTLQKNIKNSTETAVRLSKNIFITFKSPDYIKVLILVKPIFKHLVLFL